MSLGMAHTLVLVGVRGASQNVASFALDTSSGALSPLASSDCGINPSYMAIHPDGKHAYAVNEHTDGKVVALALDSDTGALTRINEASTSGDDPCHVLVHPSGRWIFVSNYSSRGLSVLPVDTESGALGAAVQVVEAGKHAHHAVLDVGGRFLLAPFLGADAIFQFCFDATTGILSANPAGASAHLPAGAGPRHIFLDEARRRAFVINEIDCTIAAFAWDGIEGVLRGDAVIVSTLPPGISVQPGYSTAHICVSPDGEFVIGSNRGHNSLVVYRVSTAGELGIQLSAIQWESADGRIQMPRDFAITADGRWVIVANQTSDTLTVLSRNAIDGTLSFVAAANVTTGSKPCYVGLLAQ